MKKIKNFLKTYTTQIKYTNAIKFARINVCTLKIEYQLTKPTRLFDLCDVRVKFMFYYTV